jgi:hypothetical protein
MFPEKAPAERSFPCFTIGVFYVPDIQSMRGEISPIGPEGTKYRPRFVFLAPIDADQEVSYFE